MRFGGWNSIDCSIRAALSSVGMMQLNGYDRVVGGNLKDRRPEMLAWSDLASG